MWQLEIHAGGGWAAAVAARLRERLAAHPHVRLCLPTGDTPAPAYRELAAAVARGETSLARAEVVLLDEFGGLPPDHPARCERMLRRELLDHVDLPEDRFHHPDLDAELARFAGVVARGGLDLAVVGLGANGHVGLNEPGSTRHAPTRRVELAPPTIERAARYGDGADPAPTWGVTLGMAELLAAREVWLLVTGAHKAPILKRVLEGPVGAEAPASLLREHPRLLVLADEDAAAQLAPSTAPR